MIISRVPLRVSFVGGGTDLENFYRHENGQVVSTTIDKYIYVAVKKQSDIVDKKYRLNWSQVEFTDTIDSIKHPIIRETFRELQIDFPCEVTTFSDLPGHTGLGSSSSFTVGLLQALFALREETKGKEELAELAARIEIDILKRPTGKQDHYAASFGGMNVLTFTQDGSTLVEPVIISPEKRAKIFSSMFLFYTGIQRDSSPVLRAQVEGMKTTFPMLQKMKHMGPVCRRALEIGDIKKFGTIISKNWNLKKELTSEISTSDINQWLDSAKAAGALGGKLLGAGGGGFLLIVAEEKKYSDVVKVLPTLTTVACNYEPFGARITYYDN